jgi:hypothetical protein
MEPCDSVVAFMVEKEWWRMQESNFVFLKLFVEDCNT